MSLSPVSFMDGCSEVPVFIVSDEKNERTVLYASLRDLKYKVSVFSSGSEVQNAIIKADHHVILILDWKLSDCAGIFLCRELSSNPPSNMVHSILVVDHDNRSEIAFALDNGADDVIVEPFELIEFRAHLHIGMRMIYIRQRLIEGYRQLLEHYRYVEKLAKERADQLIRADRLSTIGTLSAGIAHEVNNPVSFIAVNIQIMEENMPLITTALLPGSTEEERDAARHYMEVIPEIFTEMKSGVSRIRKIIDGLKTYVHNGLRKQEEFSVTASIDSALRLCDNRLKYHISVIKEYSDTPPVFGDQFQIEQVFVNIFTNAADAIESTGHDGTLAISVKLDGSWVTVTVHDSGPGIPNDQLDKIFMPFFTTKEIGKGTGLGLSVSKNIINDHYGTLTVKNHPDGGAIFTVLLPPQKKAVL